MREYYSTDMCTRPKSVILSLQLFNRIDWVYPPRWSIKECVERTKHYHATGRGRVVVVVGGGEEDEKRFQS
jgi:siroheme synthase (precorrin-2 oxidase/ferrochelatase)